MECDRSDAEAGGGGAAWSPVDEAELTRLALAADPGGPPDVDAVPIACYLGQQSGLLPGWYMPAPAPGRRSSRHRGWRLGVVLTIVGASVAIEAAGLCATYGQLVPH